MKIDKKFIAALLAEFLASFIMQFVGCLGEGMGSVGSVLPDFGERFFGGAAPGLRAPAFVWGFSVIAATQIFRYVSGAHINPCISIAAMILQSVDIVPGILYIIMQFLGSSAGFGAAYGMQDNPSKYCTTLMGGEFKWWKGIVVEFYITGAWVLAMCASWHPSNRVLLETISIRIGIVVVLGNLVGESLTGASMNPFRSLVPAIASKSYDYLYVYAVVPPVTAILLALIWRFIYVKNTAAVSESPSMA